jgi:transcriptional/translational regulatory protein YebC/TACO1
VAYQFDRKGQILFEPGTNEDEVMEVAIESGADDVETEEDGSISVFTTAVDYILVKEALVAAGLEPAASEVAMIPQNYSDLNEDMGEKVLRLVDALEDLDDVTNVYTNANFPEELMG